MYLLRSTKAYRKAFKRISRHKDFNRNVFDSIIDTLLIGDTLSSRYKDHQLIGNFKEYRECHISGDMLLMYQKHDDVLILLLVDIGSHSELFE